MKNFSTLALLLGLSLSSFAATDSRLSVAVAVSGIQTQVYIADPSDFDTIKKGIGTQLKLKEELGPIVEEEDKKDPQAVRAAVVVALKDLIDEKGLSSEEEVKDHQKYETELLALHKLRENVAMNWAAIEAKSKNLKSAKSIQKSLLMNLAIDLPKAKLKHLENQQN